MAAQTDPNDQTDHVPVSAETAYRVEDATRVSGCVLPLVHTSVDARFDTEHGGHRLLITVDGTTVETPPVEHVVFYAGLATLVGVGLVEWPVALALGVGHALIDITQRPGLHALGEVLEEA